MASGAQRDSECALVRWEEPIHSDNHHDTMASADTRGHILGYHKAQNWFDPNLFVSEGTERTQLNQLPHIKIKFLIAAIKNYNWVPTLCQTLHIH